MTEPSNTEASLLADDQELARRLGAERPLPGAEFRGALGRRLQADDPGYGPRPDRLRTVAAAYLAAGAGIIALGALQAAGAL